jgi:hypothetical protein
MGWTYTIHNGEIDIEIDKNLSFQDKILTLCHEMVHAWQFSQDRESDEEEALKLEVKLYNEYKELRWRKIPDDRNMRIRDKKN